MEEKILWDLYCFQCSLQFDKKSIYDMHLSIIHNYRKRSESTLTKIKSEPEEIELPIESNDILTNLKEEQDLNTNSLKQEKLHFLGENGTIADHSGENSKQTSKNLFEEHVEIDSCENEQVGENSGEYSN